MRPFLSFLLAMGFENQGRFKTRLIGRSLPVAPVVEEGEKSRKVVLPPAAWRAADGKTRQGPATIGGVTPLVRLPYFERVR